MRRFMDLPVQDYFIYERIYLMDIALKMSVLLKQVPLFVPIYYLNITCAYMMYGNMCPLTVVSSSRYCTVYGE
jgi:hypothetical protein